MNKLLVAIATALSAQPDTNSHLDIAAEFGSKRREGEGDDA